MADSGGIYSLSRECRQHFEIILEIPQLSSLAVIEVLYQRFVQWTSFLGLAHERIVADTSLICSDSLRSLIIQLLVVTRGSLSHVESLDRQHRELVPTNSIIDDMRQKNVIKSPLVETLQVLEAAVDSLHRLGVAIRRPPSIGPDQTTDSSTEKKFDNMIRDFFVSLLKSQFIDQTKAENNQGIPLSLCQQLALSISFRCSRILNRRSNQKKRESRHTPDNFLSKPINATKSSIHMQAPGHDSSSVLRPEGLAELKTRHDRMDFDEISDHPSTALSSEIVFETHEPEGFAVAGSSEVSIRPKKAKYPDPPKISSPGSTVACPYCAEPLDEQFFSNRKMWECHVDDDLQLYACISEDCLEPRLFSQFEEWVSHMTSEHSEAWTEQIHKPIVWCCDTGHDETHYFHDVSQFNLHVEASHQEYETESDIAQFREWCEVRLPRPSYTCPICNFIPKEVAAATPSLTQNLSPESLIKPTQESPHDRGEDTDTTLRWVLLDHIATHLRELGFMSLLYLDDDEDDSASIIKASNTAKSERDLQLVAKDKGHHSKSFAEHVTAGTNLWNIANKRLTSAERAQLAKVAVNCKTLSRQFLELLQEKQKQYSDPRWTFKRSNKEEVVIGAIFEKIAQWLQKFKEIGEVATQYDPDHAALPWAGVRMLLQITIDDVEALATLAEGVETISSLITRCAVLENIHLTPDRHPLPRANAMLQDGLVSLYAAILAWISAAGSHYDKRKIRLWQRSLLSSGPTLALISQEERKVSQLATSLHDQLPSTTATAVDSLDISFNSLMSMLRDLQHPMAHVAGTLIRIDESLEAKRRQQLVEWLSVTRHLHVHQNVRRGFIENTGEWLLKKKEYMDWYDSSASSSLWLRGVPGCGKSKLSSLVVQDCLRHVDLSPNTTRVAFWYCSSSNIGGNDSSHYNIMASILMQLAFPGSGRGVHPSLWDEFSRRLKDAQGLNPLPLTIEECQRQIIMITTDHPVTIIIDGLDESKGDLRDLLLALQYIMDGSQNPVKLFVSSSKDPPVRDHIHGARVIRVTPVENEKDISIFVETKVKAAVRHKRLLRGKVSPGLEMQVIQRLIEGSGESFLWASLNLQQLCGPEFEVEADVADALEVLRAPLTLLQTLEQIYQRVQDYKPNERQIANTVFGWLLISERELSNAELQDIVLSTVDRKTEVLDANFIHNLCRGFVNCENVAGSFDFAHESIRQFLRGKDEFYPPRLHQLAFSLCLSCLTQRYDDFGYAQFVSVNTTPTPASKRFQPSVDDAEDISEDRGTPSFWPYAVCYWLRHYARMSPDSQANADPDTCEFVFRRNGFKFLLWQKEMLSILEKLKQNEGAMNNSTLLREMSSLDADHHLAIFVASIYGTYQVLKRLEHENPEINWNVKNNEGVSSLYLSSVYGQDDVLNHLLVHGVDPNVVGGQFITPIQAAAYLGHPSAVGNLLLHGADPLLEGLFPTALHAAFAGGREAVIHLLINNDSCHKAAQLGGLIQVGFHYGQHDAAMSLVRKYFKNPVRLKEIQDEWTGGALQAALYGNSENEIMRLLNKISDINEPGGLFGNALQAASFVGSARWIRLLLDRGADPNSIGYCGSALRAASFGGHNEAVCLLLERGAILGPDDRDAIEACALKDRSSTLRLLINHFKLGEISDYYEYKRHFSAAIRTARRKGRDHLVDYMIQHGADLLVQDLSEDTAKCSSTRNLLVQDLSEDTAKCSSTRNGFSRPAYSSYNMSSDTGARSGSGSSQTRYASYVNSLHPSERFYVSGQPTGRSSQSMAGQMAAWDRRWSSASSGRR